MNGVLVKV